MRGRAGRAVRAGAAALAAAVLVACGGGGSEPAGSGVGTAGTTAPTGTSAPAPPDQGWHLLVLSDSSGWGVADLWAARIEAERGIPVHATDLAVGYRSGENLLKYLRTEGSSEREAARAADVVSVWVSPAGLESMDTSCIQDDSGRTPPRPPTQADFAPYVALWHDILQEIVTLRGDQPTALRTVDLYSPVIAEWRKAGKLEECTAQLRAYSRTARRAAAEVGARFVSVNAAINGPDGTADAAAAGLVSFDGIHLSGKGRRVEAAAMDAAGYEELLP